MGLEAGGNLRINVRKCRRFELYSWKLLRRWFTVLIAIWNCESVYTFNVPRCDKDSYQPTNVSRIENDFLCLTRPPASVDFRTPSIFAPSQSNILRNKLFDIFSPDIACNKLNLLSSFGLETHCRWSTLVERTENIGDICTALEKFSAPSDTEGRRRNLNFQWQHLNVHFNDSGEHKDHRQNKRRGSLSAWVLGGLKWQTRKFISQFHRLS